MMERTPEPDSSGLLLSDGPKDATQEVLDDIRAEAQVQAGASEQNEFGQRGRRFDRRSPFYIGFIAAVGVACAFALAYLVVAAGQILVIAVPRLDETY